MLLKTFNATDLGCPRSFRHLRSSITLAFLIMLLSKLGQLLVPGNGIAHNISELLLVLVIVLTSHTSSSLILVLIFILTHITSRQKRLSCVLKMIKVTHFWLLRGVGSEVSCNRVSDFAGLHHSCLLCIICRLSQTLGCVIDSCQEGCLITPMACFGRGKQLL